jgi:two-component system, response regulator RegA
VFAHSRSPRAYGRRSGRQVSSERLEDAEEQEHELGLVLVVEDQEAVRRTMVRLLEPRAAHFLEAATVRQAVAILRKQRVELVLLDVCLGEESGVAVAAAAARQTPAPAVVAVSGAASAQEAFALAQHGVRAFIPKSALALRIDELAGLARDAPPLESFLKAQVGVRSVGEMQEAVRDLMLEQALGLEDGNQAAAARRLGVTRQAVQQMMRRRDKD